MRYEIRGRIIDAVSGDGIGGVRVEAWDKDVGIDDYFGVASTITYGSFVIILDDRASFDLFDKWPDIYFKVFCYDTLLASTEDSVVWDAKNPTVGVAIKAQHRSPPECKARRRTFRGLMPLQPSPEYSNVRRSGKPAEVEVQCPRTRPRHRFSTAGIACARATSYLLIG